MARDVPVTAGFKKVFLIINSQVLSASVVSVKPSKR